MHALAIFLTAGPGRHKSARFCGSAARIRSGALAARSGQEKNAPPMHFVVQNVPSFFDFLSYIVRRRMIRSAHRLPRSDSDPFGHGKSEIDAMRFAACASAAHSAAHTRCVARAR